jgi:hypothetical protein
MSNKLPAIYQGLLNKQTTEASPIKDDNKYTERVEQVKKQVKKPKKQEQISTQQYDNYNNTLYELYLLRNKHQ